MDGTAPRSPHASLVLIVDPEQSFGVLLQHFLERLGYRTRLLADARCASRLAVEPGAHLLVTTLEGVEPDGMELLVALAAEKQRPKLIVCTEHPNASAAMLAASGVIEDARVLPRPCRFDAIASAIQTLLRTGGGSELARSA
jgi:DNA-binding NtrC family response regulator